MTDSIFSELDAEVRPKDVARLLALAEEYERACESMGVKSMFDGLKAGEKERRLRKIYRDYYEMKAPFFYDRDIKEYFDKGAELSRGRKE